MPNYVIDEMPTLAEVQEAGSHEIVDWHLFLRPTMSNAELPIVKAITRRYEEMPASLREAHTIRARRLHLRPA